MDLQRSLAYRKSISYKYESRVCQTPYSRWSHYSDLYW